MKKIVVIIIVLMLGRYTNVFAQNDSAMKAWQDYMTPGDVQKMLAKYDGTWNSNVSVWMKPGTAPMVNKSVAVNTMILDGRYQQSKIKGDYGGMPFEGFSLLGYDNMKKVFTSTWMDNFGTGTMTLEGTWDSTSKTITCKGKMFDPMSTVKEEMFVESASGEFKTMEITSSRAQ